MFMQFCTTRSLMRKHYHCICAGLSNWGSNKHMKIKIPKTYRPITMWNPGRRVPLTPQAPFLTNPLHALVSLPAKGLLVLPTTSPSFRKSFSWELIHRIHLSNIHGLENWSAKTWWMVLSDSMICDLSSNLNCQSFAKHLLAKNRSWEDLFNNPSPISESIFWVSELNLFQK